MYKKIRSLLIGTAIIAATAASAQAVPILLPTSPGDIVEIKYQNFESVIQGANEGNNASVIDAGDKIYGILKVSSIDNTIGSNPTYSPLASPYELTGIFQISVVGGAIPLGGLGNVQFALQSGDYFNFYYDTAKNFNAKAADSTARASDGNLWLSITGDDYLQGIATSTQIGTTYNYNWANPTVNNTGYTFNTLAWPAVIGQLIPGSTDSQFYFEGKVNDLLGASDYLEGWKYMSQDPFYAQVVPEPGTLLLLGAGLAGLAIVSRRKSKK